MENLEKAAMHDLGGHHHHVHAHIERVHDDRLEDEFSRKVDALRLVMAELRLMTTDEFRRHIEQMKPEDYHGLNYYERWLRSIALILVDRGIMRPEDIA